MIVRQCVASIELMERASKAFCIELLTQCSPQNVAILAGMGNNGGDAAAVSRLLKDNGVSNDLFLVPFKETPTNDLRLNLERLDSYKTIVSEKDFPSFNSYDLIIDGIFGSGLNGKVSGLPEALINAANNSGSPIVSIDIPSGIPGDGIVQGTAIHSDLTISFQTPKNAFFYPENAPHIPRWSTVDIGLDKEFIQSRKSKTYLFTDALVDVLPKRTRQSHKGSYGHALVLAGSKGKIGAAILSSKGALYSGAGLVTAGIPKIGFPIIHSAFPEAMCLELGINEIQDSSSLDLDPFSAVAIGPGIGTSQTTHGFFKELLKKSKEPLIMDADALNLLSMSPDLVGIIPEHSILTPHIKEFDRLTGGSSDSIHRYEKATQFSTEHKVIVVLKDAFTRVFTPDGSVYINTFGNAGMATAGSGDVLTGIITGLRAQGIPSAEAAILGVYFHAKAGDAAKEEYGMYGLTAGRLLNALKLD